MSRIADYLNRHLDGDVTTSEESKKTYSVDGSVLKLSPSFIVHPRTVEDVRKIARFSWRLAERGEYLQLTARGMGMDTTGGALSDGVVLSFPAYMSHLMEYDKKSSLLRVQAGANLATINEAMSIQGLSLPVMVDGSSISTVGGLLSGNAVGYNYAKYGTILDYTDRLEVVLANGEVIQTGRLSKKELNAKKGLETLEGEIYRSVDNLIEDNADVIDRLANSSSLDGCGYALDLVKNSDGSFDLTPLFVGSQGTLGIITQAIFNLAPLVENKSLIVASVTEEQDLGDLTRRILDLEPSSFNFISGKTIKFAKEISGYQPWSDIAESVPKALLFIEFDDKRRVKNIKKVAKLLDSAAVDDAEIFLDDDSIAKLKPLQSVIAMIKGYHDTVGAHVLPILPDVAVAPELTFELMNKVQNILYKNHIKAGVWGNVGAGLVGVYPLVNLANLGQRQALYRIIKDISASVRSLEGSISGANGQGRLLIDFANNQYDRKTMNAFKQVKNIFDPFDILNRGAKFSEHSVAMNDLMRKNYSGRFVEYNIVN